METALPAVKSGTRGDCITVERAEGHHMGALGGGRVVRASGPVAVGLFTHPKVKVKDCTNGACAHGGGPARINPLKQ